MKIFALESSAKTASCAVSCDGRIIGEQYLNTGLTHSQTLMSMTEILFLQIGISVSDIDLFAVAAGPGSFTGIRIGVSAVKGMAFNGNRPCAAVSTLFAMCFCVAAAEGDLICPVMDARCNQIYNALFTVKNGKIERICEDRALSLDILSEELKKRSERIVLIGDGAKLCFDTFRLGNAVLPPVSSVFQRASGVALAAEFTSPASAEDLRPFYLRLPQAERELKAKTLNQEKL